MKVYELSFALAWIAVVWNTLFATTAWSGVAAVAELSGFT
jgi:hypothetical protein